MRTIGVPPKSKHLSQSVSAIPISTGSLRVKTDRTRWIVVMGGFYMGKSFRGIKRILNLQTVFNWPPQVLHWFCACHHGREEKGAKGLS